MFGACKDDVARAFSAGAAPAAAAAPAPAATAASAAPAAPAAASATAAAAAAAATAATAAALDNARITAVHTISASSLSLYAIQLGAHLCIVQ